MRSCPGASKPERPQLHAYVETCKLNDVDPQAWLADVLARLPDHPANKVADLLPWNWKANLEIEAAVAA
jgi:transposase